jgi:hypothetical protein
MENTGQIVRSRKTGKSRYTPINNDILQSKTLTPEEKSILVHLLSLPEDWVVYKGLIWQEMNIGRNRFNNHWKGLVEKGYIISVRVIDAKTNLVRGWNHVVYEEPTIQGSDLPNFGLSENHAINKVITEQSNNSQSNKLESNNIIPKEEISELPSLDTVEQLVLWCIESNREFYNCTPTGILYDPSYHKMNFNEKELHLMNLTKQLQLN